MSGFQSYTVGRSSKADIVLGDADHSVSGIHAELVVSTEGRYFLADAGSSNGTFVRQEEKWEPLRQGFIETEDEIRLGTQRMPAKDLIARIPKGKK